MRITLDKDNGLTLEESAARWFVTLLSRMRIDIKNVKKDEQEIFIATLRAFVEKYGNEN